MKQHIDSEQLDQLTAKGRDFIREWYVVGDGDYIAYRAYPRQKEWAICLNYNDTDYGYDNEPGTKLRKDELPALSIGQMIKFLYQRETIDIRSEERNSPSQGWYVNETPALELCDALWIRVKNICNK
jgi:hypothetical protein